MLRRHIKFCRSWDILFNTSKSQQKKVPQNGYGQLLMDLIIRQNQDIPASGLKLWQLWNPLPYVKLNPNKE